MTFHSNLLPKLPAFDMSWIFSIFNISTPFVRKVKTIRASFHKTVKVLIIMTE